MMYYRVLCFLVNLLMRFLIFTDNANRYKNLKILFCFLFDYLHSYQIKIIDNKISCEKADLESIEKERTELTLPLATSSNSNSAVVNCNNDGFNTVDHALSTCGYRSEIIQFKKTMVLPGIIHHKAVCVNLIFIVIFADDYFLPVDPICYCIKCYKLKNHDCETFKDESLIGKSNLI